MAIKTSFEPKEARITFDERYYCDDFEQIKREPKKRITGTQALVEFLNTTSPEEFQKSIPLTKRSSVLFFRRRTGNERRFNTKSKPGLITATSNDNATTVHRKNYIEIIANPFTFSKSKISTRAATIASCLNEKSTVLGNSRTLSKTTSVCSHDENNNKKPVLPIRNGNTNGICGTSSQTTAVITATRRHTPSLLMKSTIQQDIRVQQSIFKNKLRTSEDDLIEAGLKQRLKNFESVLNERPGDNICKTLAQEHIAALDVVSNMVMGEQEHTTNSINVTKKRARHIQVQTMPDDKHSAVTIMQPDSGSSTTSINAAIDTDDIEQRLQKAEKELKQEKLRNARLTAALEETRDQLEVMSGLAYKKLREVWEEKTRWENACIEAKERCWQNHQEQILGSHAGDDDETFSSVVDGTVMDFLLDVDLNAEVSMLDEEEKLI